MKKVIIISMSFLLSLPMAAQKTVKASSPLELIYKIDRKRYHRNYRKLPKILSKVRPQIMSEINKVFMSDTVFVITTENIHESEHIELLWSKNDSIEYTYQLFNEKLYIGHGSYATDYVLKLIKDNKPLSNLLKECDYDYDLVTVIKIIRERPNIYNYYIYYTYFYWDPAYIFHEYEKEQYNKARKE